MCLFKLIRHYLFLGYCVKDIQPNMLKYFNILIHRIISVLNLVSE